MKNNKILSVSVAAYNLGEMIETNIKSFCESSVADKIELIITDDGSKDNTPDIVEKYVKLYPNTVKLIRKVNEGPGSTVNSGIKHATGKYFKMVDGDDWVDTKNLAEFIEFLEKSDCDMVISDYDIYDNSQNKIIKTNSIKLEPLKELRLDDVFKDIVGEMHALTFKTEILQKNNIRVDNCFYTDVEFVAYSMRYVNTLAYFNKTIYVYRVAQANQSVNPNSYKRNVNQHLLVLNHLIEMYANAKTDMSPAQAYCVRKRLASMANMQLKIYLYFEPTKEQKKIIKEYFHSLKVTVPDVYKDLITSKKCKILIWSNYLLYPLLSKLYIKMASKIKW